MQVLGLVTGAVPWLKQLLVGEAAILGPIQDSIVLLGYVYPSFFIIKKIYKSSEKGLIVLNKSMIKMRFSV